MDAIRAARLTRVYPQAPPGVRALDDLSLTVPSGRVFGLIGRNGAGKTTFIRIAATQLEPTAGQIEILGHDVMTQTDQVRARIACVPQESRPLYFLTVEEAIRLNLGLRGMSRQIARSRTQEVLGELSLTELATRSISRLSGGQRRRVMVAMVLATEAELIFLDEPITGLDPIARREVWGAIRRATREGRTTLLTTHYLDEAETLSSRLALIERGRLVLEGTPQDLRGRVRSPYRVTVEGSFSLEELRSFGTARAIEPGFLVFASEANARALAQEALRRGARVAFGPVDLEDIFLEVVGRRIEDDREEAVAA